MHNLLPSHLLLVLSLASPGCSDHASYGPHYVHAACQHDGPYHPADEPSVPGHYRKLHDCCSRRGAYARDLHSPVHSCASNSRPCRRSGDGRLPPDSGSLVTGGGWPAATDPGGQCCRPCSCLLIPVQIATAWANVPVTALPWDRRWLHCECEEKRKEIDCFQIAQAPKKRHFFHFLPGLREKKLQEGGKECWERGWENCWAQCKEVKLFSLGTCLNGWGEAWKVSQRKISTNKKKQKKTNKKWPKKGWMRR